MATPAEDDWLQHPIIGVPKAAFAAGAPGGGGSDPSAGDGSNSGGGGSGVAPVSQPAPAAQSADPPSGSPTPDPAAPAAPPTTAATDRAIDATKDLVLYYASKNLKPLEDKALEDLAKAWKEAPGGVITAAALLGAGGVTYLVKSGSNVPSLPAIPLDFLAGKVPAFRGAEAKITVTGPITNPQSFSVSITFHEQGASRRGPKAGAGAGHGHAASASLTLKQGSVKAASPESGSELTIEGNVSIPSDISDEDAKATHDAIEDGRIEVDVGGSPCGLITVLSVTDNYRPDPMGLRGRPTMRALNVRLRTSIPPMFHQGKDEVIEQYVTVRINGVSSNGDATVKARVQTVPAKN